MVAQDKNGQNFPVCLVARGISYQVARNKSCFKSVCKTKCSSNSSYILKNVDVCVQPGQLLAIMGPSGAGKTTLLNSLSGRLFSSHGKGKFEGEIFLNGELQSACSIRKRSSYVLQRDWLLDCLTVQETLQLAASFIMKNVSSAERARRVREVILELKLNKCRNCYIGGDLAKGISGGELKRTCIAIALLEDPQLLFLDEPTSGLDSSLAFDVLKLLVKLTHGGRTVICTVHQPGSHMFSMFNQLLLLSEGQVVYQGPPLKVCNYFGRLGYQCPPHFNPADFVLDLLVPKQLESCNLLEIKDHLEDDDMEVFNDKIVVAGKEEFESPQNISKANLQETIGKACCSGDSVDIDKFKMRIIIPNCEMEIAHDQDHSYDVENAAKSPMMSPDTAKTAHLCPHELLKGFAGQAFPNETGLESFQTRQFEENRLHLSQEALNKLPPLYEQSEEAALIRRSIEHHAKCFDRSGTTTSPPPESEIFSHDVECIKAKTNSLFKVKYNKVLCQCGISSLLRWLMDVRLIAWRSSINSLRHPIVGWASLIVHLILAVALGGIWYQLRGSSDKPTNVLMVGITGGVNAVTESAKAMASDFRNTCGAMFFLVTFFGFSAFAALMPFQQERVVYNRETASGMYTPSAFFVGKILADVPFQHIPASVFLVIFYWMVGLDPTFNQFLIFMIIGNMTVFAACGLFYALGALVNSTHVANLLAPICLVTCMLVAGFFINVKDLPSWIGWLQHLSLIKHAFAALAVNQFPPSGQYGFMKNTQWLEALGVVEYRIHFSIWMLILLGVGERFLAFFFLKYTNRRVGLDA